MYVCDRSERKILQYDARLINTLPGVAVSAARVLVGETDCGGLAIDRFGNFYFADIVANSIGKIGFEDLKSNYANRSTQTIETTILYSNSTALELNKVLDIHIDRDYLYWTNENTTGQIFGAVHKSFV